MYATLLGNDLVINEDSCNLSCSYCLTGQSNLKAGHVEQLIFKPPVRDLYGIESPLGERLHRIVDGIDEKFDVPLLKITGGEVFLVDGIMEFIEKMSSRYEVLVIQTNGALVRPKQLEQLESLGNVVIQISLDSHLHQGNSHRVSNPVLHEKIVARIERIIQSRIPVEIYGVLNDRSADDLVAFADWLNRFENAPVFFPFPVRGPDSQKFAMRPEQIVHVEELAARYDEFARILPPRAYFLRLVRMLKEGERRFRCHLPRTVISTFSDGVVTPCPNIWFSDMGNLVRDSSETALAKVGDSGLYQALLAEEPRLDACKKCYTPWDLLSMYFEDEISLDELCASPTYAPPVVRQRIVELKERYVRGNEHRGV